MQSISKHINLLAYFMLFFFSLALSGKSLHIAFADCNHEKVAITHQADLDQESFGLEIDNTVLDCAICDFTFHIFGLPNPTNVDFIRITYPQVSNAYLKAIRTQAQIANQSLRGPPAII